MEAIGAVIMSIVFILLLIHRVKQGMPSSKGSGAFTFVLHGFGWIFRVIGKLFFSFNTPDLYGSADFMNWRERNRLLSDRNKGVVLEGENKLPLNTSFQHIQITATTGAGKTTRFCLPNLLQLKKEQHISDMPSLVITDPTKEIYNQTSGYLESIGYTIKVIDFSNPAFSLSWNAMFTMTSHRDIEKMADILIRCAFPKTSADSSFWNESAKTVLSVLAKCLQSPIIQPQYKNLHNLRFLLNNMGTNGSVLNDFFVATADPMTFSEIKGMISQDPKVLQGAVSTARTSLRLLSNPDVAQVTATDNTNYQELRHKPTILYLFVPEDEMETYKPLLSLFYTQLFSFLMEMPIVGQPYQNVFVFLEEAGNLYIPNLSSYVTTLRKRKVSLSFILQSESQIERQYGRQDAHTILSNLNTKVYFGGLDIETCQKLERTLGQKTVEYRQRKAGAFGGYDENAPVHEMGRSLMTADEIRRMDNPLLLSGNLSPTVLENMKPHFKIPHLLKRSQMGRASVAFNASQPIQFLDLSLFNP